MVNDIPKREPYTLERMVDRVQRGFYEGDMFGMAVAMSLFNNEVYPAPVNPTPLSDRKVILTLILELDWDEEDRDRAYEIVSKKLAPELVGYTCIAGLSDKYLEEVFLRTTQENLSLWLQDHCDREEQIFGRICPSTVKVPPSRKNLSAIVSTASTLYEVEEGYEGLMLDLLTNSPVSVREAVELIQDK